MLVFDVILLFICVLVQVQALQGPWPRSRQDLSRSVKRRNAVVHGFL